MIVVVAVALFTGPGERAFDWLRGQGGRAPLSTGFAHDGFTIPQDDPWRSFLAPESACPGRNETSLAPSLQQRTAVCLVNYARGRQGLAPLPESAQISQWSALKAADIVRCGEFAHTACGLAGDAHARAAGFTGAVGENLFLGPQEYRTALAAVDGWLNSPEHRANLFRALWMSQGIAVLHTDSLRGQTDVAVWVSQFST